MRHFGNAIVLAAGLLVAGAAQAAEKVSIGVVNTISDIGVYIADEAGYFRAEGIEPDFQAFDSAARMVAPLGSGQLDVGGGAVGAGLYNAVSRGIDIKIVADKARNAPGYGFTAIMARKDLVDKGELKTMADFKGRKFAIPGPGTGDSSTLDVALKAAGGAGFSDINPVYMSFSQEAAAFANGAIDAGFASEPNVTLEERAGTAVRFIGVDKIYPNQQTAVLLYSGDFATKRADVARRFMRAYLKALRDYNDALDNGKLAGPKGDAVIAILARHMRVKDPDVLHAMVPHAVAPDGAINVEGLERDRKFFVDSGLAPASVTVQSVLDDTFRRAALSDLQKGH